MCILRWTIRLVREDRRLPQMWHVAEPDDLPDPDTTSPLLEMRPLPQPDLVWYDSVDLYRNKALHLKKKRKNLHKSQSNLRLFEQNRNNSPTGENYDIF